MGTRTVRLDDEAENTLARLRKTTGLSISEVLKRGLQDTCNVRNSSSQPDHSTSIVDSISERAAGPWRPPPTRSVR